MVFQGTFDFCDCAVGVGIDWNTLKVFTGMWVTPQAADAEAPDEHWMGFFLKTLIENFEEDGSYGIPMYTFIAHSGEFTVIPVAPDKAND